MKISSDVKLDFDDVLLVPQRSTLISRKNAVIEREFHFYHSPRTWHGIPIITANMPPVGNFSLYNVLCNYGIITCLHKYYPVEELIEKFCESGKHKLCWVSIGKSQEDIDKVYSLTKALGGTPPNICIDVPNGYTEDFIGYCAKVRETFSQSIIMAGNVVTREGVQELILHGGVDIAKVGIGPSQICATRKVTGCGYPQLSAVDECSQAAHGLKSGDKKLGLICSDGGVKTSGDICKAFSAGADFVMCGSMFAGVDECEGEWTYRYNSYTARDERCQLKFYGLSSHYAQEKHAVGKKDYRANEGEVTMINHKGPLRDLVQEILGGLRSCCTYIGASTLKDMSKCAQFVRVNRIK